MWYVLVHYMFVLEHFGSVCYLVLDDLACLHPIVVGAMSLDDAWLVKVGVGMSKFNGGIVSYIFKPRMTNNNWCWVYTCQLRSVLPEGRRTCIGSSETSSAVGGKGVRWW